MRLYSILQHGLFSVIIISVFKLSKRRQSQHLLKVKREVRRICKHVNVKKRRYFKKVIQTK